MSRVRPGKICCILNQNQTHPNLQIIKHHPILDGIKDHLTLCPFRKPLDTVNLENLQYLLFTPNKKAIKQILPKTRVQAYGVLYLVTFYA